MTLETLTLIAAAGAVSYALRALPVALLRNADTNRRLFRYFDYAAYAVIGGLIAGAVLGPETGAPSLPLGTINPETIGIIAVAITFGLSLFLQRPILCLALGIGTYQALLMFAN